MLLLRIYTSILFKKTRKNLFIYLFMYLFIYLFYHLFIFN